ncbi:MULTISPECIES: pantoate--beta-alanine ligase [unclassified Hydrogenobaculum]|uniref:pantoate--beta-alanine ligase n=1 Tax=unclassified Hydrogenobaculum TaxID=2622382 RepID=UPI0001C5072E|nr:pantoate/beta-alanine ligase [Hydrogenobaculum sp. 3684]AEG46501.1 Pantothenate synthetase [Hydrogenobaculum sp. SHO]AGG15145.1 pantoate/beta-alanine ligase [Hydrogenobaculum sp. HO]AGH93443.1 pantoate--beta-alanine ligase [Hydrogenobaculum sp. SN]
MKTMDVCKDIDCVRAFIKSIKQQFKTIGFVPTMGYLHEGHMSLVKASKNMCDITVVSIFVNPKQFGPKEDYSRYPRNLERDLKLLEEAKIDMVFIPDVDTIYPEGFSTTINIGPLADILEGTFRPGHFDGVCTVVTKLFNIIKPDKAFFGEKDYQQLKIIQKLVKDLNLDIEIVPIPTKREEDGLAMSSRNAYLNQEERRRASSIYRFLLKAKEAFEKGIKDTDKIIEYAKAVLDVDVIDYIKIVDKETLEEKTTPSKYDRIFIAVRIGSTRLIDNVEI